MKPIRILATGAACLALLASATVFSAEPDMPPVPGGPRPERGAPPPHGPGGPGAMPMHGVALTDAQQQKIFVIIDSKEAQREGYMAALREAHDGLRALALAPKFDDTKAAQLAQAAGKAVAAMALLDARADAQVQALLTPEQRAQAIRPPRRPMPAQ